MYLCGIKNIPFTLFPIIGNFVRGFLGEFHYAIMKAWHEYNFEFECKRDDLFSHKS